MDIKEFLQRLHFLGLEANGLDEAVHEWAAAEAADVNNQGPEAQVHYLREHHHWREEDFLNWVKNQGGRT